ncbi:hypothetical protein H7K05_01825 [Priestia aryabhattai]|uniref:hypothetical protein n=2 Tax=Priestia aryabhattai TaxID=412384 RepID=UPI001C8DDDAE|nr:hypothetical protein [Priestia aryabhattai]MBY0004046.1 hypothetical protein [Priestia aryabhattai]MBY0046669.1 hypothetical protein [Priestia aryabhattai]
MNFANDDFIQHLIEQYDYLLTSIRGFDTKKKLHEAKRMATTVRVLVHDTKHSTSILTHLRRKNILFCNSSIKEKMTQPDGSIIINPMQKPMYYEEVDLNGVQIYPNLDSNKHNESFITFDYWWNKDIILENGKGDKFTRKDIVLALSNKDGGAHVDVELTKSYGELTRGVSTGETFQKGTQLPEPIKNPHLYTMRQITYEVITTLNEEFEEFEELK